ncbi:MAG: hypothetical protein JXP48_11680 [Acidobacteria bacterium]|nr:hypothetical protein [Acidobacteriota bacterium]
MRKMILAAVMMLALAGVTTAQDTPKWEVFGGYSLMKGDLLKDNGLMFGGMSPSRSLAYDSPAGYGAGTSEAVISNGFDLALTRNLNSWAGIKANFSSHYGSLDMDGLYESSYDNEYYGDSSTDSVSYSGKVDYRRYNVLLGPQFSWNNDSVVRPFAHALFGVSKMTADDLKVDYVYSYLEEYGEGSYSDEQGGTLTGSLKGDTNFAMALGGGLDLKAGKHVSVRLIQVDYVPTYNRITTDLTMTDRNYDGDELYSTHVDRVRTTGGSGRYNNLKLSFGVVFNF